MEKKDIAQNTRYGKLVSIVGIIVNALLAVAKILVGSLFGLISVVADGLNNLTDCGSSVVSLVSFHLSMKPADKEHPYGHERIEYVCSMVVAFMVLLVAFDTAKEALSKIITPTETVFTYWIVVVLTASILVKLSLHVVYKRYSKRINSPILEATATDCLTDCISTSVTLVCFVVSAITGFNADGYAGIAVSLFIAWSAIDLLRGIFSNLIGKAPDESMIRDIKERIMSHEGVLAVHDLSVYSYGPNKYFASAHIEVSASVDVMVSHELVDEIEIDFYQNTNVVLTGHLDPIETDNPHVTSLRSRMEQIILEYDPSYSIHDFRLVEGERHTNVLFDVVIPYDTKRTREEIRTYLDGQITAIDPRYRLVVTIEYGV